MTSRLMSETKELLCVLARDFRSNRNTGFITAGALWRWCSKGVQGPGGRIVKLEYLKIAGRFYSSRAAIERFIVAQQDEDETAPMPIPARSPGKRQRASEKAAEQLAAAGI